MGLILKNGIVFDPKNGIRGEKMDLFIKDGKIVAEKDLGKKSDTIDLVGKVVFPGGVDIHAHIAGSKVNSGRLFRPEDSRMRTVPRTNVTRAGSGFSVPTTYLTGYTYSEMGYTTVIEPAVPPLKARHTHEEFHDIPMLDKTGLLLLGNNHQVIEYLKAGDLDRCREWVAWMLLATKCYGIKCVNPGGTASWAWGKNVEGLDDPCTYFEVTPREIIRGLVDINENLGLPHAVHLHCNNLGAPGNYTTAIETIDAVKDLKNKERSVLHLTHLQFNGYGGDSWKTFESKGVELAEKIDKTPNITVDTGNVCFEPTTTMTADGPFEFHLHRLSKQKWVNFDVELEAGTGIVPYEYKKNVSVNAVQWAVGLEMVLALKDLTKIHLTTDHPNGGPFTCYAEMIAWLMSKKARAETIATLHDAVKSRAAISDLDRELDLFDICLITRGTAQTLGLANKGHLGIGADADVAVYDIGVEEKDGAKIERAFRHCAYTIKGGELAVKDGKVVNSVTGKTLWIDTKPKVDAIEKDLRKRFEAYYSVSLDNYPVDMSYLGESEMVMKRCKK